MNTRPTKKDKEAPAALPDWSDCDLFCIHDYAGTGTAPCGWRGRFQDAALDSQGSNFRCPRCGGTTLFPIRSDGARSPSA